VTEDIARAGGGEGTCCKAGRVAVAYDLGEFLVETLGEEWADPEGASLRGLARRFNQELLRSRYAETGTTPLESELETAYDLLTTDEQSDDPERRRLRNRLTRRDIDVDQLTDDFVSYRTLDRHFKQCTDREKGHTPELSAEEAREKALDRVRALERRLEAVSKQTLDDLSGAGHISDADRDITVDVEVRCHACGESSSVRRLLVEGCPGCGEPSRQSEQPDGEDPSGVGETA
jgi:hypothetical protein